MSNIQPDTTLPKTPAMGKYVALLTQTGTAAPVVVVIQNTTGKTWTWTRLGTGQYKASPDTKPTANKVATLLTPSKATAAYYNILRTLTETTELDYLTLITTNGGAYADELLDSTTIQIEIYK